MAENNKGLANTLHQPLKELDFRSLIRGPLKACVDAQQEAAMATYNYLKRVMLEDDPDQLGDFVPTPVTFYFTKDGVLNRLTVPLMSIVPIPYLQIGQIDLRFKAEVTADANGTTKYKYAGTRARVEQNTERKETNEIKARESLDIRIRATSSDMPAGMAKLMEILDTQITDMYDVVDEEKPAGEIEGPADGVPETPMEAPAETAEVVEEVPEVEPEPEEKPAETPKKETKKEKKEEKKKSQSKNSKSSNSKKKKKK